MMRDDRHTVIVSRETLDELHALRATAGLSRATDAQLVQIFVVNGMAEHREWLQSIAARREPA